MRVVIELRRALSTMLRRRAASALQLLVLALLTATPAVADDPWLRIARDPSGLGLVLPAAGLWISGDFTLALDVPENQPTTGEIDDVSLLARWEPTSRLGYFTELRLEDIGEVHTCSIPATSAHIAANATIVSTIRSTSIISLPFFLSLALAWPGLAFSVRYRKRMQPT